MTSRRKLVKAIETVAEYSARLDRIDEAQRLLPTSARDALLIINSKSGPNRDSLSRVRELVDLLARYGITVEVVVKVSKKQAARDARAAARAGCSLVIAAGGDGTVESVARGLLDTDAALGIIPLGTYNNIAASLGVPADPSAACALIATGAARPIDVGEVFARGMTKPKLFLEMATVGVGALLAPLGQHIEKRRLREAAPLVPRVMSMEPTSAVVQLDGESPAWPTHTILLTVSNTPRAGAAVQVCAEARVDDGLLDLILYEDMRQADLAARLLALQTGTVDKDRRVRHARARSIHIFTHEPMPVAAGSKLLGVTPAQFTVRTGALRAVVGHGPGLARPATELIPLPLVDAADEEDPQAREAHHTAARQKLRELTEPIARPLARLTGDLRAQLGS